MKLHPANEQAFPRRGDFDHGMTMREFTAITIMAGMKSRPDGDVHRDDLIKNAIEITDDLLEALAKTTPENPTPIPAEDLPF